MMYDFEVWQKYCVQNVPLAFLGGPVSRASHVSLCPKKDSSFQNKTMNLLTIFEQESTVTRLMRAGRSINKVKKLFFCLQSTV